MAEAEEQQKESKMEEMGHYTHRLHLVLEGAEAFTGQVEIAAAAELVRAHMQMARDLRKMHAGLATLYKCYKNLKNGPRAAEGAQKIADAKRAITEAEMAFSDEKKAVGAACELLKGRKLAGLAKEGSVMMRLAKASEGFTAALKTSRIGAGLLKTGKILTSPAFTKALVVVGGAIEAFASYTDSTAQTTAGKVVNAGLGGATGTLTLLNPYVALGDLLTPKGYKLSEVYHGGSGAVTVIGEMLVTGNTAGAEQFHQRSKAGHYGKVMQASSEAGDFWADKGVYGGLKEFYDSLKWWHSH